MNRRGFTLVELLAVILIIGILSLITIPTVESVINRGKKEAYDDQLELILSAAEDWAAAHIMELPDTDGEYVEIELADLKKEGFLEVKIINPMNDMCFSNATVIRITRSNNGYTYKFADGELEFESADSDCRLPAYQG